MVGWRENPVRFTGYPHCATVVSHMASRAAFCCAHLLRRCLFTKVQLHKEKSAKLCWKCKQRPKLRSVKVGVNPSLKTEMWLLMDLITKKTCAKMYKSIHFWNQKKQMNPMVATDFCKIMRFSRNSSVTMVTIEFFLDSITKIWFY